LLNQEGEYKAKQKEEATNENKKGEQRKLQITGSSASFP
jgi:hypothetical protein